MATPSSNSTFLCPITREVMRDPVIGSDGITYERSAIEAWFNAGNHNSPLTRQPMSSRNLVPNYALKAIIEESLRGRATAPSPSATPRANTPAPSVPPPPITIKANHLPGTASGEDNTFTTYHISLSAPDTPAATIPTLFIDVLDISGSMGSPSVDTNHGNSEAALFSRSDLVRHAVATQIELLRPQDKLALVLFDHRVTVALEPTTMDAAGRALAKTCLPSIFPNGGTNIWQGLLRALTLASQEPDKGKMNVVIILQTDGESDPSYNPPRGIVDTFKSWLDKNPDTHVTVHTVGYGFGSALDMTLLRRIAEAGRGTPNYVPDGSMVGTVFIHLMSNLMSCLYRNLRLQVPEVAICEDVGFLQGGQSRDFIISIPETAFTLAVSDHTGVVASEDISASSCSDAHADADSMFQKVRLDFVTTLSTALSLAEGGDVAGARSLLDGLEDRTRPHKSVDPRISSLLTDLRHPDTHKGQITKAFDSATAFERWGRHYIPGLISGHANQWAINFKDEGSKLYGGVTTKDLVLRGDETFNTIPAPPTSCDWNTSSFSSTASISMASINNARGPCFLGGSLVKMAGGLSRRCDEIKPGEVCEGGSTIRCVVKTLVASAQVVRLGTGNPEGGFTMWHPVLVDGKWQHPVEVVGEKRVEQVHDTAVYNFVLDKGHLLTIDGIVTCTLGHCFTGPVVGHPYFGKAVPGHRHILDDLRASPGWAEGYVTWSDMRVQRDEESGLVMGMTPLASDKGRLVPYD